MTLTGRKDRTSMQFNKIGTNVTVLFAARFFTIGLQFLLFPFIVNKIGKEAFGIYLLAISINGYFGLLDFGVSQAIVKYVAQFKVRSHTAKLNEIICSAICFYLGIGIVISLSFFSLSFVFQYFLNFTSEMKATIEVLFRICAFFSLFTWPTIVFTNVLKGMQKYDLDSAIFLLVQILNAVFIFIVLRLGYNVVCLLTGTLFFSLLGNVLCFYSVKRLLDFEFDVSKIKIATFKMIFGFSSIMFILQLCNLVVFQLGHLIIGTFISLAAITVYDAANKVQQLIRTIDGTFGTPFIPAASEIDSLNDVEKEKSLFLKGSKSAPILVIPVVLSLLLFMKPFFANWLGKEFSESIIVAQILILFWFFNTFLNIGVGVLMGKGKLKAILWSGVFVACFTLILSLVLVRYYGLVGVAIGATVPPIINFPIVLSIILKTLKVSFNEFFRKVISAHIIVTIPTLCLCHIILSSMYPKNFIITVLEMCAVIIFYWVAYHFVGFNKRERRRNIEFIINVVSPLFYRFR